MIEDILIARAREIPHAGIDQLENHQRQREEVTVMLGQPTDETEIEATTYGIYDDTREAEEVDRLTAENARLRKAAIDCLASLVAARSLLSRGGKKAAASDKMFAQMLVDYANSIERTRAALTGAA